MSVAPFDPECITARILAQELRAMFVASGCTPAFIGRLVGVTDDAVLAWLKGEHLKQPVQFLAVIDALGYDVKFVKRGRGKRTIRLT
jgi:hypothetical protein